MVFPSFLLHTINFYNFAAETDCGEIVRERCQLKIERNNIRQQNKVLEKDIKKLSERVLRLKKLKRKNNISLAKLNRTGQLLRKAVNRERRNVLEIEKSIEDLLNNFSQSDSE